MPETIPEKYRDLFSEARLCQLATLMPDGVRSHAVWCDYDGDTSSSTRPRDGRRSQRRRDRGYRWPSSIRKILIGIWRFAGAWWRLTEEVRALTSIRWPEYSAWINIPTASPAKWRALQDQPSTHR